MSEIVFALIVTAFLTGCGTQYQTSSKPSPRATIPIPLSNVRSITVDTYMDADLKHPVNSVDISTITSERIIVDEINSSKSVPLPTGTYKVVAPEVGPNSVSYKVTVWLKTGQPRIFSLGSWGPTYDDVYDDELNPGLSRGMLGKLSPPKPPQK